MRKTRRKFSADFKRGAVARFEMSGMSVTAFCREMGVDHSNFHDWIARYGTRRKATPHVEVSKAARPHRERIARWLATQPRDLHGTDWSDLCASVSESVSDRLNERHTDGQALLDEVCAQGFRTAENAPPRFGLFRFTLKLFETPITSNVGRRKWRGINPWGPYQ